MVTLGEIARACNGKLIGDFPDKVIHNTTIDSRECNTHSLFIAINNQILDNYCYINNAIERGALILGNSSLSEKASVIVKDSDVALKQIASLYRQKNAGKILAITGSVGKTTVKELCVSIIKKSGKLKLNYTEGNKNNTLGLPLTLMKSGEFDATVLEAGISEPGEMEILSEISRPDIAVITNIGKMHSESLGSVKGTALEKLKISDFMPKNGILLIPSDSELLIQNAPSHIKTFTVGESDNADFLIQNIRPATGGTLFSVKSNKRIYNDLFVPIIGRHGAINGAFALTASAFLGIDEKAIRLGLASYTPCTDRQSIIKKGNLTVISDCYNAGPESMSAAFSSYEQIFSEHCSENALKIFLLGDMLELGDSAEYEHFIAGKHCGKLRPDLLIAYGNLAHGYIDGAVSVGVPKENCLFFKQNEAVSLFEFLATLKNSSALILIKGSRGMKMERFTSYLTKI